MRTPEEIKKELQRHLNPGAPQAARERLQQLPQDARTIGLALLGGATGPITPDLLRDHAKAKEGAAKLDARHWRALINALFPAIAEHVEASWRLQMKLPYQVGYQRKAFRAPNHPESTAAARTEWLAALLKTVIRYDYDLEFLMVWAAHLGWGAEPPIGLLLAGVLESDSPAQRRIFENLVAVINGEHDIARMGRSAVTALVSCSRPEAWEMVEKLLLAAQRQEGLRQVVLESIDFAHPQAFLRMLRLIEREKLSRFAAVARAVAVWFGMEIDSAETKLIDALIRETLENFEDQSLRAKRLKSADGQSLYLALWASAFDDAIAATAVAAPISHEPLFNRRYAAVHLLSQVGTVSSLRALLSSTPDLDLRVALKAALSIPTPHWQKTALHDKETFDALRELIPRTPEDKVLEPAIWEWNSIRARRADLASRLIWHRGDRPFSDLRPFIPVMDSDGRRAFLHSMRRGLKEAPTLTSADRDIVLSLLPDQSSSVRQEAFELLKHAEVSADEARAMEPLLARKASDLRRGVMRLLLRQDTAGCRASIDRLLLSGDSLMKQAAEEMRFELEPKSVPAASMQDGLGLFDPEQRTTVSAPEGTYRPELKSPVTADTLHSLDALIDHHRETPVTIKSHGDHEVSQLLGNLKWYTPHAEFPMPEVWLEWWHARRSGVPNGELARALCMANLAPEGPEHAWQKAVAGELVRGIELKFRHLVRSILWHLLLHEGSTIDLDLVLDVIEKYQHLVSVHYVPPAVRTPHSNWRGRGFYALTRFIEAFRKAKPELWAERHWQRYWRLARWADEGLPGELRNYPPLELTLEARKRGIGSDADVYEQLLGASGFYGHLLPNLAAVTQRKPAKIFEAHPELHEFVQNCRRRILETELQRGDLPTAASAAALSLKSVFGAETALSALRHLGKEPLSRGYLRDNQSKSVVMSHILRVCLPLESDTPESFAESAKRLGLSKKRLVNLAMYSPQWASYVQSATGISGLDDAAYWLHAHTKDQQWAVEPQIRELWFAEVSERTPLSREELLEGAVDVDWFHRVKGRLGNPDWDLILDSAKYASGASGHKRAELFAAAISGEVGTAKLVRQIGEKRTQDSVRALGLVDLPADEPGRRAEILQRYEVLQKFLRESRKFGALRQASEKLAYSIGLTNLARTARYADPQRLSWAMEAEAAADLRAGPVVAEDGAVKGVLSVNAAGEPELVFEKNGKPLKDLPASLRKSPTLSVLRTRKTQLAQQTSRMRQSLEDAMIRGDRFTLDELAEMEAHPLLKPMIAALLFAGENGGVRWHSAVSADQGLLRVAHPVDLLNSGGWPEKQHECIQQAIGQPFKQAFREVYLLTQAERDQKLHSARYEGQQVNPKQAMALIGKRGWVNVPEEGVRKTFHDQGLSAWVTFLEGWFTPADVDGLTVQHVVFTNRTNGKVVELDQVNPRVFSEAMRDLDLMVSVAHRGGVDPEASASTVEMRAALLRETLPLLKIQNVRLSDRYAFVDGKIGAYNIHLGSGTVHRQPGGSLCIIPVHSQHRGRIFLPFADDDPKTAEIVSKVVLLAQDDKIKDPTILEQLR